MPSPSPTLPAAAPRPRASVAAVLRDEAASLPAFTARELSRGLERIGHSLTRQAVSKALRQVPVGDTRKASGNQRAPAWHLEQIPDRLRSKLSEGARKLGYRDATDLLRDRSQPLIRSLAGAAKEEIDHAIKLRAALRVPLASQSDRSISRNELIALGVERYKAEFGHACSPGHWWKVFRRVIDADAGAEAWDRLEIYLVPKTGSAGAPQAPRSKAIAGEFDTLATYISSCANPDEPSAAEWRGIWDEVFAEVKHSVTADLGRTGAESAVRQFLSTTRPFRDYAPDALRKAFYRARQKYEEKKGAAGSVADNRQCNTGNHDGYDFPEHDKDLLCGRAVENHEGRIEPAWFNLLNGGEFSAATQERYSGKSQSVPNSIREAVRGEVEILSIIHQGPRAFTLAKGHVRRTKEGIPSLFCMTADDVTLPVYWYVPAGAGGYALQRGQCLVMMCFRTNKILGWSLQPDSNYSSINIRSLFNRVFAEYQVPSVLYLENGTWKKSALLKGRTPPFSNGEVKQGLRELGIRFIHHRRPQAKGELERAIGRLQDLMAGELGWCGREEKKDAPESLRRQMAEVLRKTDPVHPSKYFHSFEQWNARIGEVVAHYNATPQPDSRHLDGLSPGEACEKFKDSNPPLQFTDRVRLLFATDKEFVPCLKLDGFVKRIGKRQFVYRGKSVSHFVGHPVWTFFDPENPERCVFTDKNRSPESVVSAELHEEPGALDAVLNPDSEKLIREKKRIEDQASHLKAKYNVIKRTFDLPKRHLVIDAKTVDMCDRANAESVRAKEEKREKASRTKSTRQVQTETRLPVSATTAEGHGYTREEAAALREFMDAPAGGN